MTYSPSPVSKTVPSVSAYRVLYSAGRVPSPQSSATDSLMPEASIPEACRIALCSLRFCVGANGDTLMQHAHGESVDEHVITREQMADVYQDIWAETVAWIRDAHQEANPS